MSAHPVETEFMLGRPNTTESNRQAQVFSSTVKEPPALAQTLNLLSYPSSLSRPQGSSHSTTSGALACLAIKGRETGSTVDVTPHTRAGLSRRIKPGRRATRATDERTCAGIDGIIGETAALTLAFRREKGGSNGTRRAAPAAINAYAALPRRLEGYALRAADVRTRDYRIRLVRLLRALDL